jgi:SEC-C motif-containing protein
VSMKCYCGLNHPFSTCCEPFLTGKALPKTAEELMRSRYCAYATFNPLYLLDTVAGPAKQEATDDIPRNKWVNLTILSTSLGCCGENFGTVEFTASFEKDGKRYTMHELSQFERINGKWFYTGAMEHDHHDNCQHCH